MELRGDARVLRRHPGRRARPRDLREHGAVLDQDDRAGARDLHARLAPLADYDPLARSRAEAHEVRSVRADEAGDLLGDDVEDPLGCRRVATAIATRFRAACSSKQGTEVSRGHVAIVAWGRTRRQAALASGWLFEQN